MKAISRRSFVSSLPIAALGLSSVARAQQSPPPAPATLFQNVRIFDGKSAVLSAPSNVLVRGSAIARISTAAITAEPDTTIVAGNGRTLMPGLIDTHTHVMLGLPLNKAATASPWYLGVFVKGTLEKMLLRGYTTIRDLGVGADGSIAAAVDEGTIAGPRIFPSAMTISQTGGHGDARLPYAPNAMLDNAPASRSMQRAVVLVDGVPEMLAAVRENLKAGATQIKIHAGGGATSDYDPLFTAQFIDQEIRAAVEAAENWGTYVIAHAYNDKSIKKLVDNGVRQIAHGHLMSDEVAQLLASKNIIVQPDFTWLWVDLNFGDKIGLKPENLKKVKEIWNDAPAYAARLKKHGIKLAFGTDLVGPVMQYQNKEFGLRAQYWTASEILQQATGNSYEAIAMSGPLNKYGKFGVIEESALADILLIEGDPLQNIALMEDPEKNFKIIMKDGKIFKNTLDPSVTSRALTEAGSGK